MTLRPTLAPRFQIYRLDGGAWLSHQFPMHASFPSESERVRYYAGKNCSPTVEYAALVDYNTPFAFDCARPPRLSDVHTRKERRFFEPYLSDMIRYCRGVGRKGMYVTQFGDKPATTYSLCKSRPVHAPCCALMPFNTRRHWSYRPVRHEAHWSAKTDQLVWRGVTTGRVVRRRFVHELSERHHNVRFSKVVQHRQHWITSPLHLGKEMSRESILRYKYVLSLPGNDVATSDLHGLYQNVTDIPPHGVDAPHNAVFECVSVRNPYF